MLLDSLAGALAVVTGVLAESGAASHARCSARARPVCCANSPAMSPRRAPRRRRPERGSVHADQHRAGRGSEMTTEKAALGGPASGSAGTSTRGLKRVITGLTNGAITYACAGITAGIFSLFAFALESSGPAFFWGWLIVGASLLLACLNYAELASHYPFAAAVYHWPLQLACGERLVGRVAVPGRTAVAAARLHHRDARGPRPAVRHQHHPPGHRRDLRRLHSRGDAAEPPRDRRAWPPDRPRRGGRAVRAVRALGARIRVRSAPRPDGAVQLAGTGSTFTSWLPGFVGGGIFVGLWALFTFETACTLGEETIHAQRQAPRAILGALGMSVLAGTVFLFFFLLSIPNLARR